MPLLPLLLGLGSELQDVDASQYADVARRMVASGDWLVLSHSQGPFVNKPPFSLWAQAASIWCFGPTAFAARLPIFVFIVGVVAALRGIGRELHDARTGDLAAFLAGLALGTHLMVVDPKVDAALTFASTLGLWAFLRARSKPAWAWLGWAAAAAALLSKGPLGVALIAFALAPEALREGRLGRFKPFTGPLLLVALAAPFYVATARAWGVENVEYLLWRQSMGRFYGQSGYVDRTTALFFVHTGAWAFWPLTGPLVLALVKRARAAWSARALPTDWRRVPVWWLALPFAAFSTSDYKLPQYVYALVPAVALLAARWLLEADAVVATRTRRALWACGGLTTLAAPLALQLALDAPLWQPALVTGVGALALWGVTRLRLPPAEHVAATAAAGLLAFALAWQLWLWPGLNAFQIGGDVGALAKAEEPNGQALPFVDLPATHAAAYFADREARTADPNELATLVREGKTSLAVIDPEHPPNLAAAGLEATEIARLWSYPVSRPSARFLRAATRAQVLEPRALIRVRPRPSR